MILNRIIWTCPRVTIEGDEDLVLAVDHELYLFIGLPLMERFWAARNGEHRAP